MKILIYGQNGWIGNMLKNEFERQGHEILIAENRVSDYETVKNEISTKKADRVFSVIGRTSGEGINSIDYLELKGKLVENINDNLYAPLILALACKELNVHLTYMGTGCIFDTTAPTETSFSESDLPNYFGSSYSVVKGFTDRIMGKTVFNENVLNLRIRMPITSYDEPKNFISKIIRYAKICSVPNSMTVLDEFIPLIVNLAMNKHTGTVNVTNPGVISHNEILELYKELVDPSFTYSNFSIEEQSKVLKCGRSNNQLDTSYIEKFYMVDDIKTAVVKVLKKWKTAM